MVDIIQVLELAFGAFGELKMRLGKISAILLGIAAVTVCALFILQPG
jgi:hypothetical protein